MLRLALNNGWSKVGLRSPTQWHESQFHSICIALEHSVDCLLLPQSPALVRAGPGLPAVRSTGLALAAPRHL